MPPDSRTKNGFSIHQFKLGYFHLTVLTDSVLAKEERTQLGWKIIESVAQGPVTESENEKECGSIILSSVTLDTVHGKITVERAPLARPIYYLSEDGIDFYCSTHVSLLKDSGVTIAENASALPEFLVYGYVLPPNTLYANVKRLSFRQSLDIDINGKKLLVSTREEPFFPLVQTRREKIPLTQIIDTVLMDLRSAIEPLKITKENLAVLLSGGLDSSILSKIVKDSTGAKQTFSTAYPFKDSRGNPERKYAITASSSLETEHVHYEATISDFIKGIIEATAIAEEPIHLQAVLFHLLLHSSQMKKQRVVICGFVADTIFDGELNIEIESIRKSLLHLFAINPIVRLIVGQMSRLSPFSRKWQDLPRSLEDIVKTRTDYKRDIKDPSYILWASPHVKKEWVANKFQVSPEMIIRNRWIFVKKQIDENPELSLHDLISFINLTGQYEILNSIWSKIAEKAGKTTVYPFTNAKLVLDAYSIPWELKLRERKFILKKVARAIGIPEFIITRRKLGMDIDRKIWAVKGGVLEPLIPLCHRVFNEAEFRGVQSSDQSETFWHMLSYAIWKQICIEDKSIDSLLFKLGMSADLV